MSLSKISRRGCRSHPLWPFDRTNIYCEEKINQGRGRSKNTCTTIISWDMLHDFVVGEQSTRDFPGAFNEVHKLGHKEGIAENAKIINFLQKIK